MLMETGYTVMAARLLPNLLRRDAIFVVVGNENAYVSIGLEVRKLQCIAIRCGTLITQPLGQFLLDAVHTTLGND